MIFLQVVTEMERRCKRKKCLARWSDRTSSATVICDRCGVWGWRHTTRKDGIILGLKLRGIDDYGQIPFPIYPHFPDMDQSDDL